LERAFVETVSKVIGERYTPNSETWVYEKEGVIMGFIGMMGNEVDGLLVKPKFHSKGVGTALVNFIRQSQKELKVEVFEKNSIGRAF
jgi:putative acetyltransferase